MGKIHNSLCELVGNTPILRLANFEKNNSLEAEIYAKVEFFNPAGSIKDRAALEMINDAEEKGILCAGGTIIEPTSGNTGIGLAAICASRGYKLVIVMPDSMSEERKTIMRAFGAELVLTDGALGMKGAIEKAEQLREKTPRAFIPSQFDNPDNAKAHYLTTGPEIFSAMEGKVDALVCGIGTGGTISGTGRYLKEHCEKIHIVAAEPAGSPLLSGGTAGAHGLQGMGANFIPAVLDRTVYDEVLTVREEEAYEMARLLATCEGLLCGISSGAALSAAVTLARREEMKGKQIVLVLPDSGERYLSTPLYCKE